MPEAVHVERRLRSVRTRVLAAVGLTAVLALAACGGAQSATPDGDGLRDAFASQIAMVAAVSGFERAGDEMTFSGPDGSGGEIAWRVTIDSAVVQPWDDESLPYRGVVLSSWYAGGEPVQPAGSISNLPSDFLDAGIAQDCWGLWDAAERRWTW